MHDQSKDQQHVNELAARLSDANVALTCETDINTVAVQALFARLLLLQIALNHVALATAEDLQMLQGIENLNPGVLTPERLATGIKAFAAIWSPEKQTSVEENLLIPALDFCAQMMELLGVSNEREAAA